MTVIFPKTLKSGALNRFHGGYVINQAILAQHVVSFEEETANLYVKKLFSTPTGTLGHIFTCELDGKLIVIDYADHEHKVCVDLVPNLPYFKFHYNKKLHSIYPNAFCIGPMMISGDISAYRFYHEYREKYVYSPTVSAPILNKQIPRAAALHRRTTVRNNLLKRYETKVDTSIDDQLTFWEKSKYSPAHVCVPGAHNNLLDRGQLELFGLGVCTISPLLHTSLCGGETPVPDVHYVRCKNDYSDLHDKIDMLYADVEIAKRIGQNARNLFERTTIPDKFWAFISEKTKQFYGESHA